MSSDKIVILSQVALVVLALTIVFAQQAGGLFFSSASSIFSTEANAILLALKFVASSDERKFMICSDSLFFCLLAIESCKTQNSFIKKKNS
jgi:hypothetical protein